MNAETAIIVAVVVAITIVLSVALVFNGSLDEVGQSLFGEDSEGQGFFEPEEGDNGGYEFPTEGSGSEETAYEFGGLKHGKL
jgi:hypothetical protein